ALPFFSEQIDRKKNKNDIFAYFLPGEPYTHRLNKILEEYPDGSQILREILQNSDDSKSRSQIFLLDHNTYPTNKLIEPQVNGYDKNDLKLGRFQGPALLSKNDAIFEERDFQSLLNLANSEKRDQFDKIGVMGVGFNSIYHITDSPTFITGDQYVILDPHDWYFNGGIRYNFIDDNIAIDYPDQFAPFINSFGIPNNKEVNGTIFRYPLRTSLDANDSEISKNEYNSSKILEIFDKFYNESIKCLLFLNSVENIKFFELKENESVPNLLYSIEIVNAKQIHKKRDLITRRINSLMKGLNENKLSGDTTLESVFVATFRQQRGNEKPQESQWIIFGWLGDLNATATYFNETFKMKITDYKLIPNVGIAIPLNELETTGRLFCYLPIPTMLTPFCASVHGHFAVSTNRRQIWSTTDAEDLAEGTLAKLKVSWNEYLFNIILPQAWAKFLIYLPIEIPDMNAKDFYSFWPIVKKSDSGGFFNNLLLNTIKNLQVTDNVFCGPSKSFSLGNMSSILPASRKISITCETMFHLLAIENGFFPDESAHPIISKILESIGFPIINIDPKIYISLKISHHKDSLNICSPHAVRMYLIQNKLKWENLKRNDIVSLFKYVLKDENYAELNGLTMIPLTDGTFGTISTISQQENQKKHSLGIKSKSKNSVFYIGPDRNNSIGDNDERKIFINHLNKFIDKNIPSELWNLLYKGAQGGWDLNIKILIPSIVATMIKDELNGYSVECNEITLCDSYNWILKIWANFKERDYDLTVFEDIHLLPTNRGTLRKLKTSRKCFWNSVDKKLDNNVQPLIEKLGIVFVNKKFEKLITYNRSKLLKYVIGLENLAEVLTSISKDTTFPKNVQIKLKPQEAEIMTNYLRYLSPDKSINEVVKYLPIFTEVGKNELIELVSSKRNWYLLPSEDEKSYGKIIAPNTVGFLDTSTPNKRFLLESIIKVKRLSQQEYWTKFVIPYLEKQTPTILEIVIIKLFERLQLLLSENQNLKSDLGNTAFIPASAILNVQKKEKQDVYFELKKPLDLFDPNNHYISGLFFDNEHLFPARNFLEKYRDIFLTQLKTLGMKLWLSSNDIVQRLDVFANRRKDEFDIVHKKSLNLVQYIDKNYDKHLDINQLLQTREWIPTVDFTGRKLFSKANECRSIKHKNLVGLVMPIIDYSFENKSFIKNMQWDTCPPVDIVLAQLKACSIMETIHESTSEICEEVYKYMNAKMKQNSNLDKFKEKLKDKKWIFCNGKFYPTHKAVIELDKNLGSGNFILVELPYAFKPYEKLFKAMGVKQKTDIPHLIKIIKEIPSKKALSGEELRDVVSAIELIANRIDEQGGHHESLKDLLIPSTDCQLVNLYEILYDDMKTRLDDNEKNGLKIVHSMISYYVVKTLGIKMLADYGEIYEQSEQLAVRINNIISVSIVQDYSIESIFNEFLQNADDAGARKIRFVIDHRKCNELTFNLPDQNADKQNSLLSDEMNQWQGPALWIYNDAVFTPHDFVSIKKLGMGGKRDDETKIGRFGIGFNCAYHLTDLPSFVSGEHIVFFDPLQKFLPKTGNPPSSPRGVKLNFIDKDFKKRFENQASTYVKIFNCEFKKKFNGTLFRLPLRTAESELSSQIVNPNDLKSKIFENIQGSREMLFLRNIEQCSLHQMDETGNLDLIWEAKIQNINDIRELRISHSDKAKLYQLEMEICCRQNRFNINRKSSEIWLICTGEGDLIDKSKFGESSKEINLAARGGVAALLSTGEDKSLKELKAEKFSSIPSLKGKVYSYLPLPMFTSLSVHINGAFFLSSDRKNIALQANSDFITAETKIEDLISMSEGMPNIKSFFKKILIYIKNRLTKNKSKKLEEIRHVNDKSKKPEESFSMSPTLDETTIKGEWNSYILLDVLPKLHAKLLEHVTNQLMSPFNDQIFSQLWPITFSTSNIYREYGLNVLRELYTKGYKVFWSEANGGSLTSLDKAYFVASNDSTIADFLISRGVNLEIVKISEDKFNHIKEMIIKMKFSSTKSITPELVCSLLRNNPNILKVKNEKLHKIAFQLLNFVIQGDYKQLKGLQLLPLCDKSLGTFGSQIYYLAKQEFRNLFPNALSKFVADLPLNLQEIFKDLYFYNELKIRSLDADSTIDLLKFVLERDKEIDWMPSGKQYPNEYWIGKILSIFTAPDAVYDFNRLSRYPILSTCEPYNKLVLPDRLNPLLMLFSDRQMVSILVKLGVRFTKISLSDDCNPNIKQCILQPTTTNKIKSLEMTIKKLSIPLKQLFDEKLDENDIKRLRSFIKNEFITDKMDDDKDKLIQFVKTLPIWLTQSRSTCVSAQEGMLPEPEIPLFNIKGKSNILLIESDSDFSTLHSIGAKVIDAGKYFKKHLDLQTIKLDQQYIEFIKAVLSLKKNDIENYLSSLKIVPDYNLAKLVRANTLYDIDVPLFRRIYWGTGKFLHPALQENIKCLNVLRRMGLISQVNSQTFLECVREIGSRIQTNQSDLLKNDAKFLIEYLYEHLTNLNFTVDQWQELISIKFVPVDTDLESPLNETAVVTTGFESMNSMCYQEYKLLCWTQCPLFLKSIEPPNPFRIKFPELGHPTTSTIFDNLYYVSKNISRSGNESWKSPKGIQLILDIVKKTYEILENRLKNNEIFDNEIVSHLQTSAVFLNGNDPFIPEDWVAGNTLVFGAKKDIGTEFHKVHNNLKRFGLLLKIARARKIENIEFNVEPQVYSQKEKLSSGLLDRFEEQDVAKHHDVVFQVHHESGIEKIKANRYVLSGIYLLKLFYIIACNIGYLLNYEFTVASEYFNAMFCGKMKEATEFQKVTVPIHGVEPTAFHVLIRWLHGQTLEEAILAVFKDSYRIGDNVSLVMPKGYAQRNIPKGHAQRNMPKRKPFFKKIFTRIYIKNRKNRTKNVSKSKKPEACPGSMPKYFSALSNLNTRSSGEFLVDLLKASNLYQIDPLKNQVEVMIIKGSYVNIDNAVEINEWAKFLNANQLNNYCNEYIKANRSLLIDKQKNEIANADNEEDKRAKVDMLEALKADLHS
ncbi:23598_t:CDS:10, partial [Dentiscutata erythropus]